jgi:hypothetical protein
MTFTTIQEQSDRIARRKAEPGLTGRDYAQVNDGDRRTPEKRALLERAEAIRESAPDIALRFAAKF